MDERKGTAVEAFLEHLIAQGPNDIVGMFARAVDDLVRAMGLTGTSKSQVSRLCEAEPSSANGSRAVAKDERVQAFLERPLGGDWPFLCFEACLTWSCARTTGSFPWP